MSNLDSLVNLLNERNGLDSTLFTEQASLDYLLTLTKWTLVDITQEPLLLKVEHEALENSLIDITYTDYKTFLKANDHLTRLKTQYAKLPLDLDDLDEFPDRIFTSLRECETIYHDNLTNRNEIRLLSRQLDTLDPILDIPTIFESLLRNANHEEAMDLQLFVQRLPLRYPNIPYLEHLATTQANTHAMMTQLLNLLRGSVKLPLCIRVIGYLRRLGFSETSLRILFLSLRYEFLSTLLGIVKETQKHEYVRRWIETQREHFFDIVTHYNSIFPESNAKTLEDRNILSCFSNYVITSLLEVLRIFLNSVEDMSVLTSINTQVMYYGMSLGRIGLDFRPLVVSLFESTVTRITSASFVEAGYSFSIGNTSIEIEDWTALSNQELLLRSIPISLLFNQYMAALNQLRYLPCQSIHRSLSAILLRSLSGVVDKILDSNTSDLLCTIVAKALIPTVVNGFDLVLNGISDYTYLLDRLNVLPTTSAPSSPAIALAPEVQEEG